MALKEIETWGDFTETFKRSNPRAIKTTCSDMSVEFN